MDYCYYNRHGLVPHNSYMKEPNTCLHFSLTEINCWHICLFPCILSSMSWWTWHTAALFNLIWVIVDHSHVFSLLRALKLLSALADNTGMTKSSLTRLSNPNPSNKPLTSTGILLMIIVTSLLDVKVYFDLNMANWILSLSVNFWVLINNVIHLSTEQTFFHLLQDT